MIKVFLFMYICSTTPGNECKLIDIENNQFKDIYECTLSGYQQSKNITFNNPISLNKLKFRFL